MHEQLRTRAHMNDAPSISQQLARAVASVRAACPVQPSVGVVLGSGLGGFADALGAPISLPYSQIEGMPQTAVAGHAGKLVLGYHGEPAQPLPVAVMCGRAHLYEGHAPD